MSANSKFVNLWERVVYLAEQDMQPPAVQQPQTQTPTQPEEAKDADGNSLSVDGLISRLNKLRGGKSLNDAEVYGQLTTLFKQMSANDKVVIDSFLTQVAELSAVENEQQAANSQTLGNPTQPQQPAPETPAPQPTASQTPPASTSYNAAPPPISAT